MRKFLLILTIFFLVFSLIFVILPMGTIALLPTGLALAGGILAFVKSEPALRKMPKWLMITAIALFVVALGKVIFVKNEAENDQVFLQEQIQSTEEAQQELEELDEMGNTDQASDAQPTVAPDSIQ